MNSVVKPAELSLAGGNDGKGPRDQGKSSLIDSKLKLGLTAGKTREELMLATLPPHIDVESRAFQDDLGKVQNITASEAARDEVGIDANETELTLLPPQDELVAYFNSAGDLILRQRAWPDEDDVIVVCRDLIAQFIDRLSDLIGVPTFGGPQR